MRCHAKSKRSQQQCKNFVVPGYTVCRMHGAGTPSKGRPGGRPIIHGRYSKFLPKGGVLDAYKAALKEDVKLLDLRDEIALIQSLLKQAAQDQNWEKVETLTERLRKLTSSQWQRYVDSHKMITMERAMLLVAAVVEIVRKHVTDGRQLSAIAAEIRGLVARQDSGGTGTASPIDAVGTTAGDNGGAVPQEPA